MFSNETLKSSGDLDRLFDKFIKGKTAQRGPAPHTLQQQTNPAHTQTHTAPHRQRQSNTQRAAFTSRRKRVVWRKWEEWGKSAERLCADALHASAGSLLSYWQPLICIPQGVFLEGCTTMSSFFHLSPLKLKKPLGVRLTYDDYRIQIKEQNNNKTEPTSTLFSVSVTGRTETPSGHIEDSVGF